MEEFLAGKTPFERLLYLGGALWVTAKIIDAITAEHDTVNYSLYRKRQLVYHGIAYEDRLDARLNEHAKDKKFDDCIYDHAKPRHRAAKLERKRILRDRPVYNIQHNSF